MALLVLGVPVTALLSRGERGTAPALAAFLVRRTGDVLAAAWYATGLLIVAVICVLLAPETAGRPLDTGRDRASELHG